MWRIQMKIRKFLCVVIGIVMITGSLAGCTIDSKSSPFNTNEYISVISREDGSGTRGAFVELFGVEQKDASGKKYDYTTLEAIITNSTAVMMSLTDSDKYAIGYISLGSMNSMVKAVKIEGVEPTAENIKNGTYKISRPFNIATKGSLNEVSQDFVDYILSADGQAIIEKDGYIKVSDAKAYSGAKPSGKIIIAGSSSLTPVMEKLKEAYLLVNTNAQIEIQESDSTTGMASTISGICDIGMASRALKDSEKTSGLSETTIAMDGIVVIVNKYNNLDNLTTENVKDIFMGKADRWSDIIK